MKLVGHIITVNGIRIDEEKVSTIREFPTPKNLKDVRSFLGLINLSSKFTDRIAFETAPLVELTKKGVKWTWGPVQSKAFEQAK